uniref:Retrotransposon gag domain-containing protein n=1 Tax=Lactuca sativa TaxID=4236 RepID=A0A9R1V7F2_LACSA|nr:hypothetical protein LSAT_V11C600303090 [Lactuca sativa]
MTALDETPLSTMVNRTILGEGSSTSIAGNVPQPPLSQQGTTPVGPLPSTHFQMPPFFVPPLQQAQSVHSTTLPSSHVFNISPSFATPSSFQMTGGQSSTASLPPLAQTMINHSPPIYPMVGAWTRPTIPGNGSLQQPLSPPTAIPAIPLLWTCYLAPPSHGMNPQYQQGASTVPGQEGFSRSVTSLFVKELLDCEIPNTEKLPTLKTYNGTTDPNSHIDTYEWTITSLKLNEKFWCTYFPTTLDGNAGTWFKTLQPGSISNFAQLKYLFHTNFMQLRKYKGDSHSIIGCKQKEGKRYENISVTSRNSKSKVEGLKE